MQEQQPPTGSSTSEQGPRLIRLGAALTAVSLFNRVASYLREAVMAYLLGASLAADQYTVAYSTFNLLGAVLGGAFGVVSVPQLVERELAGDRAGARHLVSRMGGALLVVSGALAGLLALPAWQPAVWGILGEAGRWNWWGFAAGLPLVALFTFYGYVLNARERFFLPVALPVLSDAVVVFGVVMGLGRLGAASVGWSFALGSALIMVLTALRAAQLGLFAPPRLTLAGQWPQVLPALLTAAVPALLPLLARTLAVPLVPGDAAVLHYAGLLTGVPVALLALPAATVLLPYLSRSAAHARGAPGDAPDSFRQQTSLGLVAVLVLALPAATGLAVLAGPIASLLFGRGAFDAAAVVRLGRAVAVEAPGVLGLAAVTVLQQGWYARRDTATPLRVALLGLTAGVGAGLALRPGLGYLGLGLGLSVGHLVAGGVLIWLLQARGGLGLDRRALGWMARSGWATLLMGLCLLAWSGALAGRSPVLVAGGGILVGVVVYCAALWRPQRDQKGLAP